MGDSSGNGDHTLPSRAGGRVSQRISTQATPSPPRTAGCGTALPSRKATAITKRPPPFTPTRFAWYDAPRLGGPMASVDAVRQVPDCKVAVDGADLKPADRAALTRA